jgi:hypothetical protein
MYTSFAGGHVLMNPNTPKSTGPKCVFYYCRTYYKAVRVGGRRVEDMCYERRRAEACVD